MGLDIVEFVMDVEEEFGVSLPDREASRIQPVGQLHEWIVNKLRVAPSGKCLSSQCCYQLRRALMTLFQVPRRLVRPDTVLHDLVPAKERRNAWARLNQELEGSLPALTFPTWLWFFFVGLVPVSLLGMVTIPIADRFVLDLSPLIGFGFQLAFLAAMYLSYKALVGKLWLLQPVAVHFPRQCQTVRGAVKSMLRSKYGLRAEPRRNLTEGELWSRLHRIVVDDFGVKPDEVTKEKPFRELA